MYLKRKRFVRYGAPAAVVVIIAAGAGLPKLSSAAVPSGLPSVSPQQLLADVFSAKAPDLSGSLTWTADLGLSDLSSLEQEMGQTGSSGTGAEGGQGADSFDPLSLLSGNFDINIWLDGTSAEHLALIQPSAQEVDFVRNGDQAWLWDSANNSVAHWVGVTGWAAETPGSQDGGPGTTATSSTATSSTTATPTSSTTALPTPQQLAARLLSGSAATTSLSVGQPVYVAGQPAYQLLVTPKDAPGTTVDHVEVDVGADDSLQGVVLNVSVYAQGQASPALGLGFTGNLNLGAPPASELTFTPPPGASVITHDLRPPNEGAASAGVSGQTSGPTGSHVSAQTGGGTSEQSGSPAPASQDRPTTLGQGWTELLTGRSPLSTSSLDQGELSELTTVVQVGGKSARLLTTELANVLFMPDGTYYAGFVTPQVLEAAATSDVTATSDAAAHAAKAAALAKADAVANAAKAAGS